MPRRLNKSKLSKKSKRGGSRKKSMNRRKNILKKKRKINTKKKLLKKRNHFLRGGMDNRNKIEKLEEAHRILYVLKYQAEKVPGNDLESVKTNVGSLNDILGNSYIIPADKYENIGYYMDILRSGVIIETYPKSDPLEFLKENKTQKVIGNLIQNVGKYIYELKSKH